MLATQFTLIVQDSTAELYILVFEFAYHTGSWIREQDVASCCSPGGNRGSVSSVVDSSYKIAAHTRVFAERKVECGCGVSISNDRST
jgi:hypothetical protein